MNCKKCGLRLDDTWVCCPSCGTRVDSADPDAQNDPSVKTDAQSGGGPSEGGQTGGQNGYTYGWNNNAGGYGAGMNGGYSANSQQYMYGDMAYMRPMKWYKFLVKFFFWFVAAINVLDIVSSVNTLLYGPVVLSFSRRRTKIAATAYPRLQTTLNMRYCGVSSSSI